MERAATRRSGVRFGAWTAGFTALVSPKSNLGVRGPFFPLNDQARRRTQMKNPSAPIRDGLSVMPCTPKSAFSQRAARPAA